MEWQEIRAQYPEQWLLLEAIQAHSETSKRVLEQLSVLAAYHDSTTAMRDYAQLHHEAPERELYVFHTSRKIIEIAERKWLGIRAAL